jgi:hypothetical protein
VAKYDEGGRMMFWFWWPLVVLLVIFILLCIIPATFQIRFLYMQKENYLRIQIKFWPVFEYRKIIPVLPSSEKNVTQKEPAPFFKKIKKKIKNWRRSFSFFQSVTPTLLFLLRRTELRQVHWRTRIGLFDAAQTGLAIGYLWGIKGFLLGLLYRLSSPSCLPVLVITPDFLQPFFAMRFEATISIRLVYILFAGIRAGYFYLKHFSLNRESA